MSQMHQTDANNLFFCSLLTKKTSDKRHYFAVTSELGPGPVYISGGSTFVVGDWTEGNDTWRPESES